MKVLVVLFLTIASACALGLKVDQKLPNVKDLAIPLLDVEERITNGKPAAIANFPYQVGLNLGGSWCGGSLISTTWILTAAHCVDGQTIGNIHAYMGSATRQGGTYRLARAGYIHGSYNRNTLVNDVAVLQIDPVTLSSNIAVVNLAPTSAPSYDGSSVLASGWGKTTETSSVASSLQYAVLKVISNSVCAGTYGSIIQSSTICTSTTGGIGTCNGDSGGPLVLDGTRTQVGVVSFVSSAGCMQNKPAGFARVSSFRKWISDATGV